MEIGLCGVSGSREASEEAVGEVRGKRSWSSTQVEVVRSDHIQPSFQRADKFGHRDM